MMKKMSYLFLFLLIFSCSSQKTEQRKQKAQYYYSFGTDSLIQKNYAQALQALLQAEELDPENSEIQNNLGMAYFFKKDLKSAISHIKNAIKLDPKNSDAKGNLGSLYLEKNMIEEAEEMYLKVLKDLTYPKQTRTYYNLGVIELRKKNINQALVYFKKSVEEEETYCPSHMQIGHINFQQRNFKSSYEAYLSAGKGVCGADPTPIYYQALALIEAGDFSKARLKLDDLDARFGTHKYGAMARTKRSELPQIEARYRSEVMKADKRSYQTPSF